ncbi:hypothetical protein Afil01_25350 [Actinorhabdospora filicis]|uniref:YokE-like PH domain-containing protein n=1 Tax=Actinorhabdospora filicis TaxID=1785913 RepID=A0A9W6SKM3_9ACTN|nr:hypothetical protein [Actinorhabdospora filicis]GLZ77728.1 hypothetical protein Afil01_25350 [Actinorhabdospora filicis]
MGIETANGEHVLATATGTHAGDGGLVVVTDRRIVFVPDEGTGRPDEELPLAGDELVEWQGDYLTGQVTIRSPVSEVGPVTFKGMPRRDGINLAEAARTAIRELRVGVDADPAAGSTGPL